MTKQSKRSSDGLHWYAEQIRYTIFPRVSPLNHQLIDIWRNLRDDDPDKFSFEPTNQQIQKLEDDRNFLNL